MKRIISLFILLTGLSFLNADENPVDSHSFSSPMEKSITPEDIKRADEWNRLLNMIKGHYEMTREKNISEKITSELETILKGIVTRGFTDTRPDDFFNFMSKNEWDEISMAVSENSTKDAVKIWNNLLTESTENLHLYTTESCKEFLVMKGYEVFEIGPLEIEGTKINTNMPANEKVIAIEKNSILRENLSLIREYLLNKNPQFTSVYDNFSESEKSKLIQITKIWLSFEPRKQSISTLFSENQSGINQITLDLYKELLGEAKGWKLSKEK